MQELEDLQADIKVYKNLDKNEVEQAFWTGNLPTICSLDPKLRNMFDWKGNIFM